MPAAKSHLVYQIRAIFKILGFQKFKVSAVILYVFSVSSSLEDTHTVARRMCVNDIEVGGLLVQEERGRKNEGWKKVKEEI